MSVLVSFVGLVGLLVSLVLFVCLSVLSPFVSVLFGVGSLGWGITVWFLFGGGLCPGSACGSHHHGCGGGAGTYCRDTATII